MDNSNTSHTPLFGGTLGWNSQEWTDSDDRVRGGSSQSYLHVDNEPNNDHAVFTGNLDTKTLGGAGFASQRTRGDDKHWDLSFASGIALSYRPATTDEKKYTLIMKDTLLRRDPKTAREQSTVSWEYDFQANETNAKQEARSEEHATSTIYIPWHDFKPTYRGRPIMVPGGLRLNDIRRISIMNRSFFDTQSGPFKLDLVSITTYKPSSTSMLLASDPSPSVDADSESTVSTLKGEENNEKSRDPEEEASSGRRGFWARLNCL